MGLLSSSLSLRMPKVNMKSVNHREQTAAILQLRKRFTANPVPQKLRGFRLRSAGFSLTRVHLVALTFEMR